MAYYSSTKKSDMPKVEKYPFTEKTEMIHLNKRLADYITKVRDLSKAASLGMDPSDYSKAMQNLEGEVITLMDIYGKEVNNLRQKLDEANRALACERDNRKVLEARIEELNRQILDLVAENEKLKQDCQIALRNLSRLKDEIAPTVAEANNANKWRQENDELRRALNDEVKRRQNGEATAQAVRDKADFDNKVKDQRVKELEERVNFQKAMIDALEKRLKSPQSEDKLPAALQQLRDANAEEMRRLKRDTKEAMDQNLDTLKQQVDDGQRLQQQMASDMASLEDKLRKFAAQNKALEGKNLGLKAENDCLRDENERERLRQQQIIADLERKMKELQDQLMSNVNNFLTARDAQATLRTEIDTYRTLLDQGNRRMGGGSYTKVSGNNMNSSGSMVNQPLKKAVRFTDVRHSGAAQPATRSDTSAGQNKTPAPYCMPSSNDVYLVNAQQACGKQTATGDGCAKGAPGDCCVPPAAQRPLLAGNSFDFRNKQVMPGGRQCDYSCDNKRISRYPGPLQTDARLGPRLVTLPAIPPTPRGTQNPYGNCCPTNDCSPMGCRTDGNNY